MFDNAEYGRALDEFLINMESVTDERSDAIALALGPICNVLGIGRVGVCFYENTIQERESEVKETLLYETEVYNDACIYTQREDTMDTCIAVYSVNGTCENHGWDEVILSKIKVLLKTLYSFHGRIRTMRIASEMLYKDHELGVYNLNYFVKMANYLIDKKEIGKYCACRFNLKGFSSVNDRVGRRNGTLAMKKFVKGLQLNIEDDDIICRVGGDNFIMLFNKTRLDDVKLYLAGQDVYLIEEDENVYISASTGFYMIDEDCDNATDIMDSISMAAKVAKNSAETAYTAFFDSQLLEQSKKNRYIEEIFVDAMANEEFKVFYQPKVDLKDYLMVGAEALCRWFHDGKIVFPGDFIPVLERSQAICQLDFYMLDHVCKDIRRWIDTGKQAVKVSVNLSRKHLGNSRILEDILDIIDRNNVPHEYIEIELTETTMDLHFDILKQLVTGLRNNGISTSVDDFGTGYSSLNLLREAPWSVLKIDRSYLPDGKNYDEKRMAMLKHLIALSADMGFECIVEGVETVEQLKLIKRNNCFLAQGFYFDKPLAVEEFETRLMYTET